MNLSISFRDIAALCGRCEITSARTVHGQRNYEDGAVVPADCWQPLTKAIAQGLRSDQQTHDSIVVELVRIPDIRVPAKFPDLAASLGHPDAAYLGQSRSQAHELTTTTNPENGRRVGLHVDNWDRLSYQAKQRGRRRLCFNLGPGDRFFLLGDVDIRTICRTIHDDYTTRYPHTNDLRAYVANSHPMRCLRIRLAPGEGYLAPTELMPHDGLHPEPERAIRCCLLARALVPGRPPLHCLRPGPAQRHHRRTPRRRRPGHPPRRPLNPVGPSVRCPRFPDRGPKPPKVCLP